MYEVALTHRSYAYEQAVPVEHNERLELLGDSVLGVVVTDLIYRSYPEMSEGEMARVRAAVVNAGALADVAAELGLGEHVRLGKGEETSGGRNKRHLLADTFEAVVGAVYLDRGIAAVTEHLLPLFTDRVAAEVMAEHRYDAKTALQEVAVKQHGELPEYRIASTGPDHDKHFTAAVFIDNENFGEGSGSSKKEAEQNAARAALRRFGTAAQAASDAADGADGAESSPGGPDARTS